MTPTASADSIQNHEYIFGEIRARGVVLFKAKAAVAVGNAQTLKK